MMVRMNRLSRFALPLAALLMLPACDRDTPTLGDAATRELGEMQAACTAMESEHSQEYLELFARVQATGDVKQASVPHRVTLLHLAALHKKAQLVQDLLQAGADPNARTLVPSPENGALREGDSVLGWALVPQREEGAPQSEVIPVVSKLIEAGADVSALDAQGLPLLVLTTLNPHPTAEDVFLYLLAQGAVTAGKPANEQAASLPLGHWVADRCWLRALAELLHKGYAPQGMLPELARHAHEKAALDCVELLLAQGAKPHECSEDGTPALCEAAAVLEDILESGDEGIEQARSMVIRLLKAGADVSQPCGALSTTPGLCAADLLRADKELPARLAEAGLAPLPALSLDLSGEGEALLMQVCRAGKLDESFDDKTLAAQADKLAALLTAPSEAMKQSVLFPLASGEALRLLARVDAARAAKLLVAHPCWADAEWGEEDSLNGVFLTVLAEEPALVLPAGFLQAQAVAREAAGQPDLACTFIELLVRDASAQEAIERLCSDERLALRVGGLTARLLQADLPEPRNGCVADWAAERGLRFEDAPPAVKTAWLATSMELIWLGEASETEREEILAAMRSVGAPKAADFYAHPEGDAPEDMTLELEEATAKYIWQNRVFFDQFPLKED